MPPKKKPTENPDAITLRLLNPMGDHASAITPPTQENASLTGDENKRSTITFEPETPGIDEDSAEVKELRRWLTDAGVPKTKQDERIRIELTARRGDAKRV